MITRREWIATMCAAPGAALLARSAVASAAPASPVAIARCVSYDEDVTARLAALFDQLGGLERLVRAKTVTIKVNMTGSPGMRVRGKAPALTHYTHPKVLGATAYLMSRAGARRIRFVESAWASAGPAGSTIHISIPSEASAGFGGPTGSSRSMDGVCDRALPGTL